MAEPLATLRTVLGPRLVEDPAVLAENSSDFGRLIQARPLAVARPADAKEVAAVVRWAREAKVPLVTRGKGHSQSGLSLAEGAVVLDLSSLASIGSPDPGTGNMRVGGGAAWREVAAAAVAAGRIPPVLTNNLAVSVGGTLSVAGLGISSFRYGCQGDQVVELEVVTGAGDLVTCSAEKERDLFDAVRSGLGLFGVITGAVLRTVPVKPKVRTYYLLYDDLTSFMKDAQKLMTEERFGFIESWCVPSPQGFRKVDGVPTPFAEWFFPLHASVEFRLGEPPDDAKMLAGLGYYRKVHVEDRDALEFANRLEPLFDLWKRAGYWAATHPWMEAVLPWESAAPYITGVLGNLPPHVLGGGHILLWPSRGGASTVPLFMKPKSEFVMGFGILPGLPPAAMAVAGPLLQRASDLSLKMGAKRYPSGWLAFDAARWQAHYGEKWPAMVAAKKRFDPDGVLHPGLLPFGA